MRFVNRSDAGRRLARRLGHLRGRDVVVVGLPGGGVPVAFEVAEVLEAPLDIVLVRKIGVPFQPELALGAVGEDGVHVLNPDVIHDAGIRLGELDALDRAARANLIRRAARLRNGRSRLRLAGRTAVVVDDGVATGATMRAACRIVRAQGAAGVVVAVPVGAPASVAALRRDADEVICVESPPAFIAVGEWYDDFSPVSDEEVGDLLARAAGEHTAPLPTADPTGVDGDVSLDAGTVRLAGHLSVPSGAPGLVVFVHGSGSSRHSPRNRYVAGRLTAAGLGTLLFDLLSPAEEANREHVFCIGMLADRLITVIDGLRRRPDLAGLPLGLFGASTGAAAALWAAADPRCGPVAAVVCRGGRPDLGGERLPTVTAPTLLIVGGADSAVLDLNRAAQGRLTCPNRLVVVPGATHLFEEPRALETVADLAVAWFRQNLVPPVRSRALLPADRRNQIMAWSALRGGPVRSG